MGWTVLTILAAIAIAEFLGYSMQVLMHNAKYPMLSREHMIHHLLIYGPEQPQQSEKYLSKIENGQPVYSQKRKDLYLPAGLIMAMVLAMGITLQLSWMMLMVFVVSALLWYWLSYVYMHEALHQSGFWMMQNRFTIKWFLELKKAHEIHHLNFTDSGKLLKNYGICFHIFDRMFGTFEGELKPLNENGFRKAKELYAFINDSQVKK